MNIYQHLSIPQKIYIMHHYVLLMYQCDVQQQVTIFCVQMYGNLKKTKANLSPKDRPNKTLFY